MGAESLLAAPPSGGSDGGDGAGPPRSTPSPVWGEALLRVSAAVGELVGSVRVAEQLAEQRHDHMVALLEQTQEALRDLRASDHPVAEERRAADTEVSVLRARNEATAAAAAAIEQVRGDLDTARGEAARLRAELQAATARRGAMAAMWGAVADAAAAVGDWAKSGTGGQIIASACTAIVLWVLHRIGILE